MQYIQGSEIRYADSTKQVPIRARQNRQARAGTNFTKPRTSLFSELCTSHAHHMVFIAFGEHSAMIDWTSRNEPNMVILVVVF